MVAVRHLLWSCVIMFRDHTTQVWCAAFILPGAGQNSP